MLHHRGSTLNPIHVPIPASIKHVGCMALLVGTMMLWGLPATARRNKAVTLQYDHATTTVPLREVREWTESGELSADLQQYFGSISIDPDTARDILNTEIYDGGIPLGRSNIQFLAIQIARKMGDPLRRERRNDMEDTLRVSFANDRKITILEIIENYPDSTVRVDLKQLNRLRTDIKDFVERIGPVLNVAEQLLPDLVCDCEFDDNRTATLTQPTLPPSPVLLTEPISAASSSSTNSNDGLKRDCQSAKRDQARERYQAAIAQLKTFVEYDTPIDTPDYLAQHEAIVPINAAPIANPVIAQESLTPLASTQSSRLPSPIAENVIIVVGPIRPSFAIQDLDRFVETGTVPNGWRFFFSVAGTNAEEFRTALTAEVDVDVLFMDRLLNGILGEYLLFRVGQVIHTPSEDANIQALRSALIFSAVDDGKVSLLEFLRNYPSTNIMVQALNLARFGRDIQSQGLVASQTAGLEDMLLELQAGVAENVCDCEGDEANQ